MKKELSIILAVIALLVTNTFVMATPPSDPNHVDLNNKGHFTASFYCTPTFDIIAPGLTVPGHYNGPDGDYVVNLGEFFAGTSTDINDPSKMIKWRLRGPVNFLTNPSDPSYNYNYIPYKVWIDQSLANSVTDGGDVIFAETPPPFIPADEKTYFTSYWNVRALNVSYTHGDPPNFKGFNTDNWILLEPKVAGENCSGEATFEIVAMRIVAGTKAADDPEKRQKYFWMTLVATCDI